MTVATSTMSRGPRPSSLYDVLELVLDKGLVIDAYVRVSLVGIELLTIDARIVVASVDTYLRFAEAANRLEIGTNEKQGLPELVGDLAEKGASGKSKGAISGAAEKVGDWLGDGGSDGGSGSGAGDDEGSDGPRHRRRRELARRRSQGGSANGDRQDADD